ncbi:MAG TPA: protein kinase [Kofleriaceae bacterium]|nr:protein kinase [Kofleriaceae bacterium]
MGDPEDGGDPLLVEGTRVGDFLIRGFLGEGAMGQVYVAQDVTLQRRVALKFIKRAMLRGDGATRFLDEARATASFSHPHIVTLHAVGEHEGRPYLALEYLDGESLRGRLASGPLPLREALRYARAVAEAIAEAHRRGLVHADLKPENVVIPRDGRVRVVDFGVAKLVGGSPNAASGTPAYMAPERWHGVPPTGAIDVWAMGVMLHELITGRHPIGDAMLLHLAFAVDTLELPALPAEPWAQLVRDCLALDPAARPTAEAVIRRLDRLLAPRSANDDEVPELGAGRAPAPHLMTQPAPDEARLVRGILLALTASGARRPRLRGTLLAGAPTGSREAIERLIDRLVERGVLVGTSAAERSDVELAIDREALALAWPQLASWLEESYPQNLRAASSMDGAEPASDAWTAPRFDRIVASRGSEGASTAITGSERRFLFVVLLEAAGEGQLTIDAEALWRAIKPHGGRMSELAGGTTIVVLETERQVATDQAAQAARCALALRVVTKDRALAIAMGRADVTGKLPEADVLERAARLLAQVAAGAVNLAVEPAPIALDEMSAGLLDARFDVIEREAGLLLRGERVLMQGARTLLGRPTSCVGRDWELGALAGLLDECIDEREVRVVVVTAAAGMGKSRLGAELVSRMRERDDEVAIWIGRGAAESAGSTLDLLAQALRGALGIDRSEPLDARRAKLRARVGERVRAADQQRVTEFLGELIGAPFPDEGSAQLRAARQDAQLMSEQMHKAWLDFLQVETAVHPVLIILEDLHWGDFGTVRFIDTALRERSKQPWMVLAFARPEVYEIFPRLWSERNVQEIRLKSLGRKVGERLVRQVLGDSVEPEMIERLVKQADGNAFYLEELIRAVAEGKESALPETVLAMVETRLGRLPLEARRVLRAASIFGEVCWASGVTLLLGRAMNATAVDGWLGRLVEQEVLVARPQSRYAGEHELAFRHALLREGAYAMLTEEDRRLGHCLAGEWLERHGEADPLMLAGHFERGGEGVRASSFYLGASEQAFHVCDLKSTLARVDLGMRCEPPLEIRFALLGMRCEVFVQDMQDSGAVMAAAEELIRAAPRGSIPWAQALGAFYMGAGMTGRISDLLDAVELLRDVEPASEAVGRVAFTCVLAAGILDLVGLVAEAIELEALFFTTVRPTRGGDPLARYWWNVTLAHRSSHAHDDPWLALQCADENLAIFDVIGGERTFLVAHLFRGVNLSYLGAFEPAADALERVAPGDAMLGLGGSQRQFTLAWLRADIGTLAALDAARAIAQALRDHGRAYQVAIEEGRGRWVLAEVLRRMGDLDAAEREIAPALGILPPIDQPGARATLAAIHLAQGRAVEALAAAEIAVARNAAMGGCGMFRGAFVRLAHAEALHATGAHEAARRAIAAARDRLFAIAGRIADPAYRQSFLEEVPENARTLELARAWLDDPTPSP